MFVTNRSLRCCATRSTPTAVASAGRFRLRKAPTALILSLVLLPLVTGAPSVAAAASHQGTDARLQRAASWAARQVGGRRLWIEDGDTMCGAFVENAYGVSGIYGSASAMYRSIGSGGDPSRHTLSGLQHAPVGAIVFFAPNARNGYEGHVGIYVGNGQFVGVGSGGHIRRYSVQWWSNSIARYIGWAYPPANWPGPGTA
jgi:cell wall-associated NlpC family hydrolase